MSPPAADVEVQIPAAFGFLFEPPLGALRYRVAYGGRGSAKSWQFARALLLHGAQATLRILCAREYQASIKDSVHKLLSDQIEALGLSGFYTVQQTGIFGKNGTEFLFKGMRRDVAEIKSTEGIDLCWVEEAEAVSDASWTVLIPTIRKPGSELWVSFNPAMATDPTYRRFVTDPPARSIVKLVGYHDNPWLPEVLREEAEELRRKDPEAFANVWDGVPWSRSDAQVLIGKWQVQEFEPKEFWQGPYFGADWGFARDPSVLIRCWTADSRLWVEYEAGGIQLDMDETLAAFLTVPGAADHVIRADSARPETINEMRRRGLKVEPCEKWDGSVKDGIQHLRSYESIVIHPRCKRAIQEARLWRYKTDPRTSDVLPKLMDGNEHTFDALRYAMGPMIRHAPTFTPVRIRMG